MDDLQVKIDATTAGYEAAIARAQRSTLGLESQLGSLNAQLALVEKRMNDDFARKVAERHQAMERAGRGMLIAGGAMALGLGLSAKAAIDWQQDWTNVAQALDGTPDQLKAVEEGLRGLARELPVSHEELAGIAKDASQLGVETENIVGFTKVIAELGRTSDLAMEDGAVAIARFLNVTGTAKTETENVASTLVKLGQAGASSVPEIINLGLRLAAAGRTAGMTDGEILGVANAMSSLGINAEAGGTNMSKTILQINTAVGQGGDKLKAFADIAGTTSAKFAAAYRDDAGGAIVAFLQGLERIRAGGGDVTSTLAELGITSLRQIDTISRLSQNTDQLTDSMATGNDAYGENTALQEAFNLQMETGASKMQVAANNMRDLGISIGETVLPVLGSLAEKGSDLLSFLNDLPGPVKDLVAVLTIAATAALVFGGTLLVVKSRLYEMQQTMTKLEGAGTGFSRNMLAARAGAAGLGVGLGVLASKAGESNQALGDMLSVASSAAIGFSVGGPWGAAIGAGIGLLSVFADGNADAAQNVDELKGTLDEQTGAITKNTAAWVANKIVSEDLVDDVQTLGLSTKEVVAAMLDQGAASDQLREKLEALVNARADALVPQRVLPEDENKQRLAAQNLLDLLGSTNGELADARTAWSLEREAKKASADVSGDMAAAASNAGQNIRQMGGAIEATHAPLEQQKSDVDGAKEALSGYNSVAASIISRQLGLAQAIMDAKKATHDQENGFKKNTEAGQKNWQTLLAIASATDGYKANTEQGRAAIERARASLIDFATSQGMGQHEAEKTATKLLGVAAAADKVTKTPAHAKVDEQGAAETKSKIDAVRAALNLVNGMSASATVTIQTILRTAAGQQSAHDFRDGSWTGGYTGDGGKFDPAGIVHKGEFVFDKESTTRLGPRNLMTMMQAARGYDGGGHVGGLLPVVRPGEGGGGGRGSITTLADLLKMLSRPEPFHTLKQVNEALREMRSEARDVTAAEHDLKAARDASKNAAKQLDDTEKQLEKARGAEHADKAAISKLEDRLHAQRKAQRAADKDLADAEKDLSKQRDELSTATDRWKQAQAALLEQSKAYAETVKSLGAAFGGSGTSTTFAGLLAKKNASAEAGHEFLLYLRTLTRKGLDRDLLAELRAEGPSAEGLALARDLAGRSRADLRRLNRADDELDRTANHVGVFGTRGSSGHHGGQQHHHRGRNAPLVHVEHLHANDAKSAAGELHKRFRKGQILARVS